MRSLGNSAHWTFGHEAFFFLEKKAAQVNKKTKNHGGLCLT